MAIIYDSEIKEDTITVYNAGKFHETSLVLSKEQAGLLFIDLWKFLEFDKISASEGE